MTTENKIARFMRNTGPARFFIPFGIILIIAGILFLQFHTENYVETSGTIVSVTEAAKNPDEPQQYDVTVSFEANGQKYETCFQNLSGTYRTGEAIQVFYNPDDPSQNSNGTMSKAIPPIIIAVGVLALIFGVYKTIRAFQKSRALDESVSGQGQLSGQSFETFKEAIGVTEYYFRFDGHSLKPGYILEDADRKALFEGKMTKQALIGARTYDFENHFTGSVTAHEIGHTVMQTYNDEFFSAKSWFKIDGKNVWDLIHERGVRLSTDLHSRFPYLIYNVAKDGLPFARIESSSVYVHEEDDAEHKVKIPTGRMYYRIWTNSSDFDLLFLVTFAISETEQAVVE